MSRKYTPTDFIMSGRRYLLWRQAGHLVAVQWGKNSYIFIWSTFAFIFRIFCTLSVYVTPKCPLAVYSVLCMATLQSSAGAAGPQSGDINTFQHWPLFSSCWLGLRRKTLCINRVLISLLPRYSIMKHSAYFCRKFGRQLFLVVTEQAGVESQHFPPMMKNCYDISKMSNFV